MLALKDKRKWLFLRFCNLNKYIPGILQPLLHHVKNEAWQAKAEIFILKSAKDMKSVSWEKVLDSKMFINQNKLAAKVDLESNLHLLCKPKTNEIYLSFYQTSYQSNSVEYEKLNLMVEQMVSRGKKILEQHSRTR